MELHIWQFSCYVLIVIRSGQEQANVRLQYCQLFNQKIIILHLIVKNSLLRLSDSTVATELVDVHPHKVQVVYSVQLHIETMGILPKERVIICAESEVLLHPDVFPYFLFRIHIVAVPSICFLSEYHQSIFRLQILLFPTIRQQRSRIILYTICIKVGIQGDDALYARCV